MYHVVMHIKSLFATPLQERMVVESIQEWSSYYWLWLFPIKKKFCVPTCLYMHHMLAVSREADSLELELHVVVNHQVGVGS